MRIRALAVAALVAGIVAAPAAAQSKPIVGMSYDMSLPTGDLQDFADNDSWLGFSMDIRAFGASNKISFGGMLGYYEFYNNTATEQITFDQATVTGQQYRHMFSLPIMLNAHYYAGSSYGARPFIGLNAGVTYMKQTLDIGMYTLTSDAWVVSAMPEVGIYLPTSGRTMVNLHARYHIPFSSESMYAGGAGGATMSYLSIGLGFMGRPF
jgi:outer membrane protein W